MFAETLQSRRYLAGQLLFSSWISQGLLVVADPGAGWRG
ncbi:two-component system sensor kinase, partial [Salmonella enterica subsp. enterica serovar Enteritidis str. 6.0562-1]